MLSIWEKLLFVIFVGASLSLSVKNFGLMIKAISRGAEPIDWQKALKKWPQGLWVFFSQRTLFTTRPVAGFIHALVAWGFTLYMLVNLIDILEGMIPGFHFFPEHYIGFVYRLFVDIFTVLVLLGVLYFLVRRFIFHSPLLKINPQVLIAESTQAGIRRDSAIVAFFILFHVGFRLVHASFAVALHREGFDISQPAAATLALAWSGMGDTGLTIGLHLGWWLALGLILAFIPYFPYSKHAHLFMGPIKHMVKAERRSPAVLKPIDMENEELEQYGVAKLEHLPQEEIFDAYACIMCNRCQDACPAYTTGKALSPSALEINKRYYLNENLKTFAESGESAEPMRQWAISEDAIWACTSCGYCVEVCPVANEPMVDILQLRQDLTLMESNLPQEAVGLFKKLESNGNPWGISQQDRDKWADGLDVPRFVDKPDAEYLFWVGCAGAYDDKGIKSSKAMVNILNAAGVSYAILGNEEKCTGDSARRLGNEYLFQMMAMENVETLNGYNVKKIITQCPHCLNTIKNEYPDFDGNYEVYSHTDFIYKLIVEGKISIDQASLGKMTYHDSCYLGRHNKIYDSPRALMQAIGGKENFVELSRHHDKGYCCGAGGGRMWLEETIGEKINNERSKDIAACNADILGVACPFCQTMLVDGINAAGLKTKVKDIAVIVSEKLRA
ncbi:MAG TPA: (Fe-S)-binding protein [Candidatus Marinimicrobia bacterium]|nr:(Fe-S)-binding protein [Candidatus Neomarinimicrobiota bacterium]